MYIIVKTIINHAKATICKLYYPCQFSCHMSLSFFYERCTSKVANCLLNFIFADKPLTLRHKLQDKGFICARLKNSLQC